MEQHLVAGVARRDITPEVGTVLMGYAPRRSTAVHDRLTATALVLGRGNVKTALVSVTTTIIDDEEVGRIRALVSRETDIGEAYVTVCACQIHSGPATQTCYGWDDRNDAYCRAILEPAITQAVSEAADSAAPVLVGIAAGKSDVGVNRRQVMEDGEVRLGQNPWGPYDPEMTVVRFISARDRRPVANIVHYGAHPTAIGPSGDITRDWPGVMIDRVEQAAGGMTLFVNGAVGDVGPRLSNGGTTGDLAQMLEVGNRAAFDAVGVCKTIREYRELDLEVKTGTVSLPYRPLAPREDALRRLAAAEAGKDIPGLQKAEYSYWLRVLDEYASGSLKTEKVRRQTVTRIGPVALVPFAGEPFAEIVLRMRAYSPFQHTLCLSTTNGSDGYLATRDSLHRGGYEVLVAKAFSAYILAEDIDDVLIRENLRILRSMTVS